MTLIDAWVAPAAGKKLIRQQLESGPLAAEDALWESEAWATWVLNLPPHSAAR